MLQQGGAGLDYQSPDWVAQQLGIDRQTVYKYLHEGTLPALKLGRKWLISESRLQQFLADREQEQTEERRSAVNLFRETLNSGRFSHDARTVINSARDEALALRHDYLGQEHLLLAVAKLLGCAGAELLTHLGVECQQVHSEIQATVGPGDPQQGVLSADEMWFTPRAQLTVQLALEAAGGEAEADSAHLVLGILREGDGLGAAILTRLGVTADSVSAAIEARP